MERFPHRGSVPIRTHQPERLLCSPAGADRGLGAEGLASIASQGEDWGWLHENSLKGLAHHSYPGGSPGKSLQLPKRQETFLPLCFMVRKERGVRAPPKRAPEMGTSRGYQHGPQRRA